MSTLWGTTGRLRTGWVSASRIMTLKHVSGTLTRILACDDGLGRGSTSDTPTVPGIHGRFPAKAPGLASPHQTTWSPPALRNEYGQPNDQRPRAGPSMGWPAEHRSARYP